MTDFVKDIIAKYDSTAGGHVFTRKVFTTMELECCAICGIVKNLDRPNKPCKGYVAVEVR